jgi:hypothetical protein
MAGASILTLLALEGGLRLAQRATGRILATGQASSAGPTLVLRGGERETARYARNLFPLPVRAPRGEVRVFFFGGSSTQGFPYPEYSYPGFFEAAMNPPDAPKRIQAVNFGVLQGALRDVRLLIEELLERGVRPDAVVLHNADNELYYNRVRILDEFHRPARRFLKTLRDFSRLAALLDSRLPGTRVPEDFAKLHEIYPLNEENVRFLLQAYQEDLLRIVRRCQERRIPVVLTTVPLNRDYWPPQFSPKPAAPAEDEQRMKALATEGERLFYEGKRPQAAETFRKVLAAMPDEPLSHFYLGRILLQEGKSEEACGRLEQAIRGDSLRPIRPIPEFNECVRQVARRFEGQGVTRLDFDQYLLEKHGLNGRKLFIDNCHGRPETYLEMGVLAARFFVENRILGDVPAAIPDEGRLRSGLRIDDKSKERVRSFVERLLGKDSPFLAEWEKSLGEG